LLLLYYYYCCFAFATMVVTHLGSTCCTKSLLVAVGLDNPHVTLDWTGYAAVPGPQGFSHMD